MKDCNAAIARVRFMETVADLATIKIEREKGRFLATISPNGFASCEYQEAGDTVEDAVRPAVSAWLRKERTKQIYAALDANDLAAITALGEICIRRGKAAPFVMTIIPDVFKDVLGDVMICGETIEELLPLFCGEIKTRLNAQFQALRRLYLEEV